MGREDEEMRKREKKARIEGYKAAFNRKSYDKPNNTFDYILSGYEEMGKKNREDDAYDEGFKQGKTDLEDAEEEAKRPDGCFAAETGVLTPSGYTAIANLSAGATVLSFDRRTFSLTPRRVRKVMRYSHRQIFSIELAFNPKAIRATRWHSFLTQRGWMRTSELRVGDIFVNADQHAYELIGVEPEGIVDAVYNLRTEGEHTFVVDGGIIAHNYSFLRPIRIFLDEALALGRLTPTFGVPVMTGK